MRTLPDDSDARNSRRDDRQLDFGFVASTCAHRGGSVARWHKWSRGGGWHLGRFCMACDRWMSWVQVTPEVATWAPPKPTENDPA